MCVRERERERERERDAELLTMGGAQGLVLAGCESASISCISCTAHSPHPTFVVRLARLASVYGLSVLL